MTSRQLEKLYDDHAPAIFAFLLNLTRDEEEARDLLQAVILRASRVPRFTMRRPRQYLLRSAHNAFVDLVRRECRNREALAEFRMTVDEIWTVPDDAPAITDLLAQLAVLPADQRAVIHLKVWESLTFREIAHALGIPPNTAASRYRYAIDKLRTALRPDSTNERA